MAGASFFASPDRIVLPGIESGPAATLSGALHLRRSKRRFRPGELELGQVAGVLFAAQGVTTVRGYRTAPSAGALYPLELRLASGRVEGLEPGVYRYLPGSHALERTGHEDVRRALAASALNQMWMAEAQAIVAVSAVYSRTTGKYGDRGVRYADMEAGHAAQGLALSAASMGLGTVDVGAFRDEETAGLLGMAKDETPLLLMPLGLV